MLKINQHHMQLNHCLCPYISNCPYVSTENRHREDFVLRYTRTVAIRVQLCSTQIEPESARIGFQLISRQIFTSRAFVSFIALTSEHGMISFNSVDWNYIKRLSFATLVVVIRSQWWGEGVVYC